MKFIAACCVLMLAATSGAQPPPRGGNLMFNGRFDHEDDPLAGWTYDYRYLYQHDATKLSERRDYRENHKRVKVLQQAGGRGNVLQLSHMGMVGGTKVDGPPIRIDAAARYRLTMHGKTTGPNARIVLDGYQWRPGVRPHDDLPKLTELRRVFRTKPVYFGATTDGEFSNPGRQWSRGTRDFPDREMSATAARLWSRTEFVVLHVVAILGERRGDLLIRDVVLERID